MNLEKEDLILSKINTKLEDLNLKDLGYNEVDNIKTFELDYSICVILYKKVNSEYSVQEIFSGDIFTITSDEIIKKLEPSEALSKIDEIESEIKLWVDKWIKLKNAKKKAKRFNL